MPANPLLRSLSCHLQRPALAVALIAGGMGIGAVASALAQGSATRVAPVVAPPQTGEACPAALHGPNAAPWVRGELYFGTTSEEEFAAFVNDEVTPRFPDGFTLLTGLGQYREGETILQTTSKLLIILYPSATADESSARLEEIREAYEARFALEPVQRADIANVCTSF